MWPIHWSHVADPVITVTVTVPQCLCLVAPVLLIMASKFKKIAGKEAPKHKTQGQINSGTMWPHCRAPRINSTNWVWQSLRFQASTGGS